MLNDLLQRIPFGEATTELLGLASRPQFRCGTCAVRTPLPVREERRSGEAEFGNSCSNLTEEVCVSY